MTSRLRHLGRYCIASSDTPPLWVRSNGQDWQRLCSQADIVRRARADLSAGRDVEAARLADELAGNAFCELVRDMRHSDFSPIEEHEIAFQLASLRQQGDRIAQEPAAEARNDGGAGD